MRVTVEDAGGNVAVDERQVSVEGGLKLGNFRVSFDDSAVDVAGIPITVSRVYDTLDANEMGDFGYGW